MLFVVFAQGIACDVLLIIAGVLMFLVAAVCHIWFRPHGVFISNILQAAATLLNACLLLIGGAVLVRDPLNPTALSAYVAIAMMQLILSIIRLCHAGGVFTYMYCFRRSMYVRVEPDGQGNINNPPPTIDDGDLGGGTQSVQMLDFNDGHDKMRAVTCKSKGDDGLPPTFVFEYLIGRDDVGSNSTTPFGRLITLFITPKNTKSFNDDIAAHITNDHDGYTPLQERAAVIDDDDSLSVGGNEKEKKGKHEEDAYSFSALGVVDRLSTSSSSSSLLLNNRARSGSSSSLLDDNLLESEQHRRELDDHEVGLMSTEDSLDYLL
jgi:hypothetical protein